MLNCRYRAALELNLGVDTVWFGAVLSETEIETKTKTFCGSMQCDFEAKIKMKPNRLVQFGEVSNGFGSVFENIIYNLNFTPIYA